MRVIVNVSDSDKHFGEAIGEYEKRLGKSIKIDQLKPAKNGDKQQIIEKDTDAVISLLQKKYANFYKIYLSKEGKNFTTEMFSELLKKYVDVVFVIWGPYGLDEEILQKHIHLKLSFGGMTLQHGLAKLVLLEQLYRIFMIQSGREYHY